MAGGGQADKAGGSGGPVTLRLGTWIGKSELASDGVRLFASRVRVLSGDTPRIAIDWDAGGEEGEQLVARRVRTGELDAAAIATRAWDLHGATSMEALQAPFLITSEALARAVVTSPLAVEMLAGLRPAGTEGLALLPDGLLRPVGVGKSLRGPADFAEMAILTRRSRVACELVHALGAHPLEPRVEAWSTAVRKDGSPVS